MTINKKQSLDDEIESLVAAVSKETFARRFELLKKAGWTDAELQDLRETEQLIIGKTRQEQKETVSLQNPPFGC